MYPDDSQSDTGFLVLVILCAICVYKKITYSFKTLNQRNNSSLVAFTEAILLNILRIYLQQTILCRGLRHFSYRIIYLIGALSYM